MDDWLKSSDEPVFKLFGYAGTGKTTLARHFASHVDGRVMFGAYTGKAAHVLREKGCPDATTIHSMIYVSKNKSQLRLKELENELADLLRIEEPSTHQQKRMKGCKDEIRRENDNLSRPAFSLNIESEVPFCKLVIIDECSMVDERMGADLLSFGTKVLVLGDPYQLPPVGGGGYFTNGDPDVMLTDIHRQAEGNPILKMASEIRENQRLPLGTYGDSEVTDRKLTEEDFLNADQILVGKNATRHVVNNYVRKLRTYEEALPEIGDRLVCLRNNHDLGLMNGALYDVLEAQGNPLDDSLRMYLKLSAVDFDGEESELEAHTHHFLGREDEMSWWEKKEAEEFDYGYALTTHKAQGSQWDDVLLNDESWVFRADRWRWLYTAVTRAAHRITVVRK